MQIEQNSNIFTVSDFTLEYFTNFETKIFEKLILKTSTEKIFDRNFTMFQES